MIDESKPRRYTMDDTAAALHHHVLWVCHERVREWWVDEDSGTDWQDEFTHDLYLVLPRGAVPPPPPPHAGPCWHVMPWKGVLSP